MNQRRNLATCVLFAILLSHQANADNDTIQKLSQANLKFSLDVYKIINENQVKSFVTSPFSISTLFSMLLVGARQKTAEEINSTLGYDQAGIDLDQVKSDYSQLLGGSGSSQNSLGADIANSVWNSKSFKVKKDYKDALSSLFNAKQSELDFASGDATKTINSWVEDQTGGKIKSLFDDPLPASTLLVLVNAIYFKANWKIQFPISDTKEQWFHGEGADFKVQMMHVKDDFRWHRSLTLKSSVLEMEYGNPNISMVVLLPFEDSNLRELEKKLTPSALVECFDRLRAPYPSMDVYLPRFKLEQKYNLIPIMRSLNTSQVFGNGADLTGISDDGGLFVTQAVQKAYIEVNEEGTTAAAASGASVSRTMTPVFTADRPFMFMIRNKANNLISFIGRYA